MGIYRIWVQLVVGLVIIILFGVPDYDPRATKRACQGITLPTTIKVIHHETYCLCMGKDKAQHSQVKQQVCQERIDKLKSGALVGL